MTDLNAISALVLVPVFNGERHLPELISRLKKVVHDENLLFVNDGSTDTTEDILNKANVHHLTLPTNRGKGAALATGYRYAVESGYRSVLTLDSDLQHLPEEIPSFLARDDGGRVLVGRRNMTGTDMPPQRRLSNFLTSLMISILSGRRLRDSQCGFRLIPTILLKGIRPQATGYDFESELLLKIAATDCTIEEIPVSTIYHDGVSFVRPVEDTLRFIGKLWQRIWL